MSEWSNDDEAPVAPPPSTEAPPRNTHAEVQSKRGKEVPEQWARAVPTQHAMGVLEQQEQEVLGQWAMQRPTVEEAGPPPWNMGADPTIAPGGSSMKRRFKKLYR